MLTHRVLRVLVAVMCCGLAAQSRDASKLEFRERVVAGSTDDFMQVRHLVLRGSQRAIGEKLAAVARDRCGGKPWPIRDRFDARVQAEYFRDAWPQHLERMRGAAAAFGSSLDDPRRNFNKIAFHVNDLFGCSVVFYPPSTTKSGRAVFSRNLDFSTGTMTGRRATAESPAAMSRPFVIETYPDSGYACLYVATMDLLGSAFDGVNEKGLTAALLTDRELIDKFKMEPRRDLGVGFSEIQLVRYLLETCATVAEAKSAILRAKHYYGFLPCHYILGDKSGAACIYEASPSRNRDHLIEKPGEPLVTTNFMLHRHEDPMKLDPRERGLGSVRRYQIICRKIAAVAGKIDLAQIKAANAAAAQTRPGPPPQVPYAPGRTLWHAIYHADEASLAIDFYLGETPAKDDPRKVDIRRSGYLEFQLASKR